MEKGELYEIAANGTVDYVCTDEGAVLTAHLQFDWTGPLLPTATPKPTATPSATDLPTSSPAAIPTAEPTQTPTPVPVQEQADRSTSEK